MHPLTRLLVALAAALVPSAALTAQDLIGVAWNGGVFAVDSLTGAASQIGTGLPGQNALGLDAGGTLWATHRSGTPGAYVYHLATIDPGTGLATVVHSGTPDLRGLTGAGGPLLYGIQDGTPDQLASIDVTTGAVTPIGATGFSSQQALAMHQGVLYSWDLSRGLLIVDPLTGLATDPFPAVGSPTGTQFLASHPDGRLLLGQNALYAVDVTTGQAAYVAPLSAYDLRGVEFTPGGYLQAFGQGCRGAAGPVVLTGTGTPLVGGSVTSTSSNHAPNALGVLVLGFSNTLHAGLGLPLDLGPLLGTGGCFLHVAVDATLVGFSSAISPAALSFAIPLPAPAAGLLFHLQHACFEPVPGGMSWSNGLTVQVR